MNRSSRRAPQDNPLLRVLLAALAVVLVVVLCVVANSLMPRIDPAIYEPTPSPTAPGATATPMISHYCKDADAPYERHALGRFIRPEEIAELAAYLMSDMGEIICGHTVVADAGDRAATL